MHTSALTSGHAQFQVYKSAKWYAKAQVPLTRGPAAACLLHLDVERYSSPDYTVNMGATLSQMYPPKPAFTEEQLPDLTGKVSQANKTHCAPETLPLKVNVGVRLAN